MRDDLIIQQPLDKSSADTELLLLFHGVGSDADDLRPLGQALAEHRPAAWVISVRAPEPSDFGQGWQWFSVRGVSEVNRPARVASAMTAFRQAVTMWQAHCGVRAVRTTLIGFSQGAIMALESTQQPGSMLAKQVISIAGRLAQPAHEASATVVNLMHGDEDQVMPVSLAVDGHSQFQALGMRSTLDRFPGLGHGIDTRVVDAVAKRIAER